MKLLGAMIALVTSIAVVPAHYWYATGKLALAGALIALGFDEFALTEYRTALRTWVVPAPFL
ncbi:MAG: hypothetical protein OXU42_13045 [Deltaproteobacteria bacterium]|nr:hypothetical protein [Deltaproteobacteria bacterium]